jgi:hypothetical protein
LYGVLRGDVEYGDTVRTYCIYTYVGAQGKYADLLLFPPLPPQLAQDGCRIEIFCMT